MLRVVRSSGKSRLLAKGLWSICNSTNSRPSLLPPAPKASTSASPHLSHSNRKSSNGSRNGSPAIPSAPFACSLPAMNRVVAESHFARMIPLVPLDMGVGEKDVLPIVVGLPFHGRPSVGLAANTVLRVIILIRVIRQKILRAINGFTGLDISRRRTDLPGVDRPGLAAPRDVGRPHAVEIVER